MTTWYRPPDSKVEIFDKFESYPLKADPKMIESRQFKNFDSDAFIEDIKETPFHFASLMDDPSHK